MEAPPPPPKHGDTIDLMPPPEVAGPIHIHPLVFVGFVIMVVLGLRWFFRKK